MSIFARKVIFLTQNFAFSSDLSLCTDNHNGYLSTVRLIYSKKRPPYRRPFFADNIFFIYNLYFTFWFAGFLLPAAATIQKRTSRTPEIMYIVFGFALLKKDWS